MARVSRGLAIPIFERGNKGYLEADVPSDLAEPAF